MLQNLAAAGTWVMATFFFILWMVIVIARSSGLMALATFFFWPVSIFHLIPNWGVSGADIRVPFLLTLIGTGMWVYSISQVVDEAALQFTPEEVAALRAQDPEAADRLEQLQRSALEGQEGEAGSAAVTAGYSPPAPNFDESLPEAQNIPARPEMRKVPISELNLRRGEIRVGPAFANVNVPKHFRYIPAEQLGLLSETRKLPVDPAVFAWIVHDRVNLNEKDFWFIEARFESTGFLPAPMPPSATVSTPPERADIWAPVVPATVANPAAAAVADSGAVAAVPEPDPFALTWDPERAIATWSESADTPGLVDQCAARLLRHGAMIFCVPELVPERRELGLRAARLIAARTRIEAGWHHGNFAGGSAAQSFEKWLAPRRPFAAPAVVPVATSSEAATEVETATEAEAD